MPMIKEKGKPAHWVDDDIVIETKKKGKEKIKLKKQEVEE